MAALHLETIMPTPVSSALLFLALATGAVAVSQDASRPAPTPSSAASRRITLDVVVTPKTGPPAAGLAQSDFTVLDNKVARPITSFAAVAGPQTPVTVLLLIDTVNTDVRTVDYERQQIDKFLRSSGGRLPHPTSLAIFSDNGTQLENRYTADGNALGDALDQAQIGLRAIGKDTGLAGAEDRFGLSLNALLSLLSKEAAMPGRKIVLWVSPGWPYLSGPRTDLTAKQEQALFSQVTQISTGMRDANITLYSVDPLGTGQDLATESYYREYLDGVAKPSQVDVASLALQVLAVQSGGLALGGDNDIAGMLDRCMADTAPYYELTFDAPAAEHPNEYHKLDVKVSRPGLIARTRAGYYNQP